MGNFYDDSKFGVVTRTWFGLTDKFGGGFTSAYEMAGSASTKTFLTKWYPKGPIKIVKVGWRTLATASAANNATGASGHALIPILFYKSSAAGAARNTLIASDHIPLHPTLPTLFAIGSKETIASAEVEAGRFLTIFAASAQSNEGSVTAAIGTVTMGGSWAFFIDWIPKFDPDGKWDA